MDIATLREVERRVRLSLMLTTNIEQRDHLAAALDSIKRQSSANTEQLQKQNAALLLAIREFADLRDLKAYLDASQHMDHVCWWKAKKADYEHRLPAAFERAQSLAESHRPTAG